MIASDAIHQARAAVDNLVGALRSRGPTGESAFPIVAKESEYADIADIQLRGVPTWARDSIRAMQPFTTGAFGWIGHELLILHRLARADRHRAPHLQSGLLLPSYVESDNGAEVAFRGDGRTWAETEYNRWRVYRVHFEVEVRFGADVPAAGGLDVLGTIDACVRVVTAAVQYFERVGAGKQ
jgi:hypothetical protein